VSDSDLRDLERQVLAGDAAALEKLKAAWLRRESIRSLEAECCGDPPTTEGAQRRVKTGDLQDYNELDTER
jgi:hypothetical protein